jgi:putative membrane protein
MEHQQLGTSERLALMRTILAADRSLMAWVRTAMALISFGFTIFKFLGSEESPGHLELRPGAPRNAGLFLIAVGSVSLIVGMIENRRTMTALRASYGPIPWRIPMFTGAALALIGTLLFFAGIFHWT